VARGELFEVERCIAIGAPPPRVLERLVDFRRWVEWSPWEGIDPNLQRTYEGPDLGVGASYAWRGTRKAGAGRMRITDVVASERVEIDLRFERPFKAENTTVFDLEPDGEGSTLVTWRMTGRKNLLSKVFGLFVDMDAMIGKDFEKGLAQLKRVTEA
jgi:hypothetical protein